MATNMPTPGNQILSQWVKRVTSFSSQYNSDSWSANQVIGQPKVYPAYGDRHGAWASSNIDAYQYIEVQFEKPVFITRVDVYETYHAGGTKRILAKDDQGSWQVIWETDRVTVVKASRVFSPPVKDLGFKTRDLRVEIDCSISGSWVELDAIQLHGKEYYTDPPPSMEKLGKDLALLVNSDQFSDVQFLIEGKIIFGHKNILSVRSSYFKAMFGNNMRETRNAAPIEIKNVGYDSFLAIMHYLYTNKMPTAYSCTILADVWRAADQFSIEGLRNLATHIIIGKIDSENVVDVYVLATNNIPVIDEVKTSCLAYMSSHMSDIVNSPTFVDLPQQTMLEIIQLTTSKLSLK